MNVAQAMAAILKKEGVEFLFCYPSNKVIDEAALPGVAERFAQMAMAAEMLVAAGYEAVGIDHFALPADRLAVAAREGTLRRNFQGYTDDRADALIGLGASAIGQLPQGYFQNMPATGEYLRRVEEEGVAVVRGYALTEEDRARAYVIERVMCDFGFSFADLAARHPAFAPAIRAEARSFAASGRDGPRYMRSMSCGISNSTLTPCSGT